MLQVKPYSDKGLAVTGATEEQAMTIVAQLGKAVTQLNPLHGGWVFSRKREPQIRAIVAAMNATADDMPGPWKDARGKLIA